MMRTLFNSPIDSKLKNISGGSKQNNKLTTDMSMPKCKQKNDMRIAQEINAPCWWFSNLVSSLALRIGEMMLHSAFTIVQMNAFCKQAIDWTEAAHLRQITEGKKCSVQIQTNRNSAV